MLYFLSLRGASPLGLPYTPPRSPLCRLAPVAWLARGARSRDHFAAYGSTNKYRPVNRRKARGGSGEYVIQGGGVPPCIRASAMKFAMTVTVKMIDIHR
jgi:hypothetical protein